VFSLSCSSSQRKDLIFGGAWISQILMKWVSQIPGLLHKSYIVFVVKWVAHWKVVCPSGSVCEEVVKMGCPHFWA
jgi:hypothetical protein